MKIGPIIGIDLSVSTKYGSSRKLEYNLSVNGTVCGNTTVPSLAPKMRTGRR